MSNTHTATDFFAAKLAFETDVSDVAAAFHTGAPGFVLVDSRGDTSWRQGRIPGAVHLPTAEIDVRAIAWDPATPVVTYCWGPGCNGATRAALAFARRGFTVREMIGGFEYWVREGLDYETDDGIRSHATDPLTGPFPAPHATLTPAGISCDC
jgi:rhodanese-related sulfurtransferase